MRELILMRRNSLIMRPERYDPEAVIALLRQRKTATIEDLKAALGTAADATVFRKLAGLVTAAAQPSGPLLHADEIVRFDELGLWSFRQVWFSRFGTLVSTVEAVGRPRRQATPPPSWRACCTWRSRRPCWVWCAAPAWPTSRCRGVTCTSRSRPRPGGPRWRPGRSMTARPGGLAGPGPAGAARGAQGGHRVVLRPARRTPAPTVRRPGGLKVGHGGDAQIAELLGLDPTPWPGVGGNCWPARSSRAGCVALRRPEGHPKRIPRSSPGSAS